MTSGSSSIPGIACEDYFSDTPALQRLGLFAEGDTVFCVLSQLRARLERINQLRGCPEDARGLEGLRIYELPFGSKQERALYVEAPVWTGDRAVWIRPASIWIGPHVRLEPTVIVKGPALIEEGADLRQGAYLRGSTYVASRSVVGHATEVKNSIFLEHAEAGHFAYVGDSILGAGCNLGAGTKLANLQLRTEQEKTSGRIRTVRILRGEQEIDTGLVKLGAVVGDRVEIGCNTVTSPGTLLGPGTWVYPNVSVRKGIYPPRRLIKPAGAGAQVFERR